MTREEEIRARVAAATPGLIAVLYAISGDYPDGGTIAQHLRSAAGIISERANDITYLLGEVDRLRAALKPFADMINEYPCGMGREIHFRMVEWRGEAEWTVTYGDILDAKAAMGPK